MTQISYKAYNAEPGFLNTLNTWQHISQYRLQYLPNGNNALITPKSFLYLHNRLSDRYNAFLIIRGVIFPRVALPAYP